jgi:hypothetical protein
VGERGKGGRVAGSERLGERGLGGLRGLGDLDEVPWLCVRSSHIHTYTHETRMACASDI